MAAEATATAIPRLSSPPLPKAGELPNPLPTAAAPKAGVLLSPLPLRKQARQERRATTRAVPAKVMPMGDNESRACKGDDDIVGLYESPPLRYSVHQVVCPGEYPIAKAFWP